MEKYIIPIQVRKERKKEDKRLKKRVLKEKELRCNETDHIMESLKDFKIIPPESIDEFTDRLSKLKHTEFDYDIAGLDRDKDSDKMFIVSKITLFLDTAFSKQLFDSQTVDIDYIDLGLIKTKRTQNKKLIRRLMIPLFLDKEKHWILIYINVYSFEIQIFDSWVSCKTNYISILKRINYIANKSRVFWEIIKELKIEEIIDKDKNQTDTKFHLNIIDCPKQMNKYDWGVYIWIFMYLLYQMIPISVKILQKKLIRREIFQEACNYKVIWLSKLFSI